MNLLRKLSRISEQKITAIYFVKWKFKKFGVPLISRDSHIMDNSGKDMTVENGPDVALIIPLSFRRTEKAACEL